MMQQQPTQDPALSQQQQAAAAAQQQMVLCPVRVVYETQILMPPGEQMNPNQTFYINPQNQPPWANQNSQIYPQNQMVYLQNIPQNIVPAMQQHVDPNQMYIQQTYPTMPQLIQNQNMPVLAQNLQERQIIRQPVQFANIPQNMNVINVNQYGQMINMQNVANIPQNVPNIAQALNVNQPNVQIVQNQTNSPKPPDVQQSVQNINFAQNLIQNQNIQRAQMVQQQFRMMQQQIVNAQQNPSNQTTPKVIQNVQPNVPTAGQLPNQIATNIPQQQQQQQQQTHSQQSQPQQPHPQQPHPPQQHPQQPHSQQSHPQQPHPQQSHPQQSHPQQSHTQQAQQLSHPQQPHPLQSLPQQPQPQHRMVVQQNVRQTLVQNVPQQTMLQNQNMANQTMNIQRNAANTYIQQQPNVYMRQTGPADSPQYNPIVNNVQPFNQVRADSNKLPISNQAQQNNAQKSMNLTIKPRAPRPHTKIVPNQQNQQLRSMPPQPNRVMYMMQNVSPANNIKPQKNLGCNVDSNPVIPPKPTQMSVATETVNRTVLDNRKRKSESPDEAKHKIAAIEANKATYGNPNNYLVNRLKEVKTLVNDVGANSDSSHKDFMKNSYPGTQTTLDSSVQTETSNIKKPNATVTSQDLVGEKLKRNTVFGQARVRNVSNENKTPVESLDQPTMHITAMEVVTDATISKPEEKTVAMKVNRSNNVDFDANQGKAFTFKRPISKSEKIKEETKERIPLIPDLKPDVKPAIIDSKPLEPKEEDNKPEVKSEPSPNALSEKIRNFGGKQIELSHGNIHKRDGNENNYILTHVLDGIVIQESNVAFPIRLPLKERIIPNAPVKAEPPVKELETPTKVLEMQSKGTDASTAETKQSITIKLKEPKDEPSKSSENTILTISELRLDKDFKNSEEPDSKSNVNNENPLHCSKPQVVKSWTSEELASHLSKGGWQETASILLDNEIDGESLFLVSNAQLLKIGIDENHAAILSNYISS